MVAQRNQCYQALEEFRPQHFICLKGLSLDKHNYLLPNLMETQIENLLMWLAKAGGVLIAVRYLGSVHI